MHLRLPVGGNASSAPCGIVHGQPRLIVPTLICKQCFVPEWGGGGSVRRARTAAANGGYGRVTLSTNLFVPVVK